MSHDANAKTTAPRRILIIEDTKDCAILTELWIHRYDPVAVCENVISLHDAIASLDQAKRADRPYDLVILDLSLLDTSELMAVGPTIQAASPSPVFVFTNGSPVWQQQVMERGAKMFLLKRASREEFTEALGELLPHGGTTQPTR